MPSCFPRTGLCVVLFTCQQFLVESSLVSFSHNKMCFLSEDKRKQCSEQRHLQKGGESTSYSQGPLSRPEESCLLAALRGGGPSTAAQTRTPSTSHCISSSCRKPWPIVISSPKASTRTTHQSSVPLPSAARAQDAATRILKSACGRETWDRPALCPSVYGDWPSHGGWASVPLCAA